MKTYPLELFDWDPTIRELHVDATPICNSGYPEQFAIQGKYKTVVFKFKSTHKGHHLYLSLDDTIDIVARLFL